MKNLYGLLFLPLIIISLFFSEINQDPNLMRYRDVVLESMQSDLEASIDRGAIVYKEYCNRCHRPKGKGMGKSYPPLAGSDYLANNRTESIRGVKFGQEGEIVVNGKTYNKVMEPMNLNDTQIADVMNYIMNSWDNTQVNIVTPQEVAAITK
ncbi:c-type cytochrome [Ulvibacter antarcticus]|uniref:Cytochrome c n=1 Tax=Ulvibacter antarcticus TaxID=442714 RepID=A0A3L9YWW9_9FLAO|nr:cytochrome c [Ulvibacter antarcticus]RMA64834.1 cytochrome c [Ulvibacter antarcticus]